MPPKRPKVGVGKKPVAAAAATKKTPVRAARSSGWCVCKKESACSLLFVAPFPQKATEKKKRRRKKQDSWACSDPALGSYRRRQKTSALNSKVAKMERYLREKGEVRQRNSCVHVRGGKIGAPCPAAEIRGLVLFSHRLSLTTKSGGTSSVGRAKR